MRCLVIIIGHIDYIMDDFISFWYCLVRFLILIKLSNDNYLQLDAMY